METLISENSAVLANLVRSEELIYQLISDACRKRFFVFFKEFWEVVSAEEYEHNWHIEYICDELQRVGERIINRLPNEYDLIINVPPGSTKSTIVSVMFPLWLWLWRPDAVIISSSYAAALSIDHSLKSKMIFKSDRFQKYFSSMYLKNYGANVRLVKDTEADWRNNYGGGRFCTSTGGSVTGKHADLIIRDDPMNPEEAESEAERKKAHRFNDRSLSGRKKNKKNTPTITVMQRLHDDDTTGHDLAKTNKKIRRISIPAELTEKTRPIPESLAKYYTDGLFEPVRFNRAVLIEAFADLGSYAYSGQYLQDPVPEGGGKIKEEWITKADPNTVHEKVTWIILVDGAYTEDTKNDPSGILIAGVWKSKMVVRYCTSKFMEIPELLQEVKSVIQVMRLPKSVSIYIEPKASGKSVKQLLVKDGYNASDIASYLVQENKAGRINLCVPYAEAGRIQILEGAWNGEFIHQITKFPKASHDEYVDLLGYAVDKLLHNLDTDFEKNKDINPSQFY